MQSTRKPVNVGTWEPKTVIATRPRFVSGPVFAKTAFAAASSVCFAVAAVATKFRDLDEFVDADLRATRNREVLAEQRAAPRVDTRLLGDVARERGR